jgi:hypothetical protein
VGYSAQNVTTNGFWTAASIARSDHPGRAELLLTTDQTFISQSVDQLAAVIDAFPGLSGG